MWDFIRPTSVFITAKTTFVHISQGVVSFERKWVVNLERIPMVRFKRKSLIYMSGISNLDAEHISLNNEN
jgi:hypothetical protein